MPIRLYEPETWPSISPPELPATIVLVSVVVPPALSIPPTTTLTKLPPAELPLKVQVGQVGRAGIVQAAAVAPELPLKVQLIRLAVPELLHAAAVDGRRCR